MHSKRVALLIGARPRQAFRPGVQAVASSVGANCANAMPEVSPTFGWYRPQRLLSQGERTGV